MPYLPDRRSNSPLGSASTSSQQPQPAVSLPGLSSFDFPPPAFSSSRDRRPSSVRTGASSANSSPLPSPYLLPSWTQGGEAEDGPPPRGGSPTSSSLWSKPLHRLPPRTSEDPFASFSFSGTVSPPAAATPTPSTFGPTDGGLGVGCALPCVGSIISGGRATLQGGSFASRQSAIRSSFSGDRYRRSPSDSPPPTSHSSASSFAFNPCSPYAPSNMSTPPHTPATLAHTGPPTPTFSLSTSQHRPSRSIPYSPPGSDPSHLSPSRRPSLINRGHSDPLSSPSSPLKLASIQSLLHGSSPPSAPSTSLPRMSFSHHHHHPYERRPSMSPQVAPRPSSSSGQQQQQPAQPQAAASSSSRAPIQRTTRACDNCRARKTRCLESEGGEGTCCARCKGLTLDCVWSGGGKKRGPVAGTSRPSSSAAPQRPTASETRRASIATAPLAPPPSYFPPGARDLSTTFDRTLSFQHPQTSATPTSVSPPSPSVFAQQQQQQQQQWAPTPFTPSSFLKQDTHMSGGAEQMQLPGLEVMFGERRAGMRLY